MTLNHLRTHNCGELNQSNLGQSVVLCGWVHRCRDLGGLIFVDLRDRFGRTQLLFDIQANPRLQTIAAQLKMEWVIAVRGVVILRREGGKNHMLATGEIEVQVDDLEIFSKALPLPFSIDDTGIEGNEETRLRYRYLDIRRGDIANKLQLRHQVLLHIRNYMSAHSFLEVTTPILAKSTPEGARDYLVPSRLYRGSFYALPQSPQLFKQLLMIGGLDRYFQIAPCFRDEDPRADRQPEFTQFDMEMSFAEPEQLIGLMEQLMVQIFERYRSIRIKTPFRRLSYFECLERYGSDRPDLRIEMQLIRLDEAIPRNTVDFFSFGENGCIKCLVVNKSFLLSRRETDHYTNFMKQLGIQSAAYLKRQEGDLLSGAGKLLDPMSIAEIIRKTGIEEGDGLLLAVGSESSVNQALDHVRRQIARDKGLISPDQFEFTWVVDFPLLAWHNEKFESQHHPFTAPHVDDSELLDSNPLQVRAVAYDLVLNGYEIGGGSQRIHSAELQEKVLTILGLSSEEITQKFGFFIEALRYGTPPHLGMALGLDRLMMLLTGTDNIRDVIAFPKTLKGKDLMLQCPSSVAPEQLNELNIAVVSRDL